MDTPLFTVTGYDTDRRGNRINSTAKDYTKLSDAVKAKRDGGNDVVIFARVDKSQLSTVNTFLESQQFQLYPTKNPGSYILGFAKGSGRVGVACEIA